MRGAARGVVWTSCDRGEVQFMGLVTCKAGEPPLPLASGAWVKAPVGASIQVCSEPPTGDELWLAIDRFHALAMDCVCRRLEIVAEMEWAADRRTNCQSRGDEFSTILDGESRNRVG